MQQTAQCAYGIDWHVICDIDLKLVAECSNSMALQELVRCQQQQQQQQSCRVAEVLHDIIELVLRFL